MQINLERKNGTLITKVEGRIDGGNAREFENALSAAIRDDDRSLILDLEDLSYISSAGLRVILLIAKTLRKRDAEFVLCSLSDPIREVFKISGFDKIIPVHGTRPEALAALGG
jgi:anti-anti-sigma factor